MYGDVHDALASHADEYDVHRQLHDVPPHAVYEVTVDGTRAICKLARGPEADPATEGRVIRHVGRESSLPVPRVLAVGEDHFVAEWLDGTPSDPSLDADRARALGVGLATLHEETGFDRTGRFRVENDSLTIDADPSWSETIRARLADGRPFLDGVGYADVAETAIAFVEEHGGLFADVGGPVLCHGNYLLDHVGVEDGEVAAVIDFEHALAAPAEWDYWRTAIPTFGHPDRSTDDATREAFREGYESVRSLPEGFDRRLEAYRVVLAVSYLQALYVQDQWTERETERRAEALREFVFETVGDLRADRA